MANEKTIENLNGNRNKIEKAIVNVATSLGYKFPEGANDRMVKPFGNMVYILFYQVEDLRISAYHYNIKGEFRCWQSFDLELPHQYISDILDDENPMALFSKHISNLEDSLYHNFSNESPVPLGFFTSEEKVNIMLNG